MRVIGMAEKKPAAEIWAVVKGTLGSEPEVSFRTSVLPTP